MANPALELDVYGHPCVFSRNERGEYEHVSSTVRAVVYPEGHTWSCTLSFWAPDPSNTWRVTGYGKNAQQALMDSIHLTQSRVQAMEDHVLDFRDFLRGNR